MFCSLFINKTYKQVLVNILSFCCKHLNVMNIFTFNEKKMMNFH